MQIELRRTDGTLFSVRFVIEDQRGRGREKKPVRFEEGLRVSVDYFNFVDKPDQIVITGGVVEVDDNLKGRVFAEAVTAAARLLNLDPIEFMRMITSAGYDTPWKIEAYPPKITPLWREIAIGATNRSMDELLKAVEPVLSAVSSGGWALD